MFEFLYYTDTFTSFVMVATRVSAILFAAPFFGSNIIKPQIKFILSILIAILVFPAIEKQAFTDIPTGIMVVFMFKEILIGVCIGILSHFLFVGAQLGGQIAGIQIGFGMINVMDPQSNISLSIIASFLNIAMLLIFIAVGGHFLVIGSIAESFRFIPLGGGEIHPLAFEYIAKLFSFVFVTAIKIMAPVLITLLLFSTILGVIGKLVPQINLMIVGFPIKIAIGLTMLALSMNYFYIVYEKLLRRYFEEVANIIRLF
ncbi:MAG: flagellar biosynthetic protein FliR [Denitrovibrio sp.]|nr:MAG: flagellar biosynthetic protein FliR [Denitrovibrio sp.]